MIRPKAEPDHEQRDEAVHLDVRSAAEDPFDGASEEESSRADDERPDHARHRLVGKKLGRCDLRKADDHCAGDAETVQPLRDEDRRRSVALEEPDAFSEMPLQHREAVEQAHSLSPSEPEPEDVAAEGPRARGQDDQWQMEVAPLSEEAAHHQDGLAFQEGPDEDGKVSKLLE